MPDRNLDGSRADPDDDEIRKQVAEWRTNFTQNVEFTLYKAPGCLDCLETGYPGRMGIHELLMSTPEIKKMILRRAPASDIHFEAIRGGMHTRKQDGIEKILMGYTDYTQIRTL